MFWLFKTRSFHRFQVLLGKNNKKSQEAPPAEKNKNGGEVREFKLIKNQHDSKFSMNLVTSLVTASRSIRKDDNTNISSLEKYFLFINAL
ncbi:MAG: hypothetical protein ACLSE8_08955 [Parasutterella sp.]